MNVILRYRSKQQWDSWNRNAMWNTQNKRFNTCSKSTIKTQEKELKYVQS